MRAILVGDIHIDNAKSTIANSDSFTEVLSLFNFIKETAKIKKPDYIIFFGDIFNSPYSITSVVISLISKIIGELSTYAPLIFIVGNHDDVDNRVSNVDIGGGVKVGIRSSLLSPYKNFPNVLVFDSPSVVNIDNGKEIAFVPYTTNTLEYLDSIDNKFSKGASRILIGHFDIKNNYYLTLSANNACLQIPTAEELINKYQYDLVLLGHVHEPYEMHVNDKLVKYIGSSRNIDFRTQGEDKGIYYIDFDTYDIEFIKNENTCIYKVFRSFDDIKTYCSTNPLEKLAKTKVQYIYTNNIEIRKIAKLKEFFKSIQFEKSVVSISSMTDNSPSSKILENFKELLDDSLITKEKLVDFAIQFNPPKNLDVTMNILNYIKDQ